MIYLNEYERLLENAHESNIGIIENYYFDSNRIKGLYCDNCIALNSSLSTSSECACVMAEELGHHYTSVGKIIDLNSLDNSKQEQKARLWGYNKLIGLIGIVDAFEAGCLNRYEIADFLNVTEEFLQEAIEKYASIYGKMVVLDSYTIYFIPNLAVFKRV